jgi:hypothetical protein
VRSSGSADRLDLDRGLPTTADDVSALRQIRRGARIDLERYLRFLDRLGAPAPALLRARRCFRGSPFELSR